LIYVELHACLKTQVKNLHAVGHFKGQCPTSLNYSRNLGNTVYESIKRITSWAEKKLKFLEKSLDSIL